jgi:hypothetical protein
MLAGPPRIANDLGIENRSMGSVTPFDDTDVASFRRSAPSSECKNRNLAPALHSASAYGGDRDLMHEIRGALGRLHQQHAIPAVRRDADNGRAVERRCVVGLVGLAAADETGRASVRTEKHRGVAVSDEKRFACLGVSIGQCANDSHARIVAHGADDRRCTTLAALDRFRPSQVAYHIHSI